MFSVFNRESDYAENVFDCYLYEKNLQGDIIGIYNADGTQVVWYSYDAWGNNYYGAYLGDSEGKYEAMCYANPFRYRGYYWDSETGFYYCGSRYYDPAIGRFINADTTNTLLSTAMSLTDKNLYAYCDNNPVMRVDDGGMFWDTVFDVVSLCFSVVDVIKNPDDPMAWVGLAADVVSLAVPFATGGGLIVDAVTKADNVVDLAKNIDRTVETLDTVSDVGKSIDKIGDTGPVIKHICEGACFVAGTLIVTENGNVPIEDIAVGMLVYAHNPETGETALKKVINAFVRNSSELIYITVNGEKIITTPEHLFYVPEKGWTDAIQLRAGDRLQLLNEEYVVIEQVQHEILEKSISVYNFEVEDFHTYYITNSEILVHNANCDEYVKLVNTSEARKVAKELGYKATKEVTHGQIIFVNKKAPSHLRYISLDTESHIGGVWKAADTVANIHRKETRAGTYSRWLLERMGD